MATGHENKLQLSRERLCKLAGVKRRTHLLWTQSGLLPDKLQWGERDAMRAAQLGALWTALGPSAARAAWYGLASELPPFPKYLQAIYRPDRETADLATSAEQLLELLPRGVPVVIVDLATPAQAAKDGYAELKARSVTAAARRPRLGRAAQLHSREGA